MRSMIQLLVAGMVVIGTVWHAGAQTSAVPAVPCPPANVTWFEGTGSARGGILLRWNGQIVSGGVVRADGHWRMPVQPNADQASGSYAVVVEQRDTGLELGAWTCVVANTSLPTPGVWQTPAPAAATPTPAAKDAAPAATSPVAASTPTASAQPTNAADDEEDVTEAATATAMPSTAAATTVVGTPPSATSSATSTATAASGEAHCTVCIVSAAPSADDAPGYLVISNAGNSAVDLAGWTVHIADGAAFTLPQHTLQPEESLTITLAADDGDGEVAVVYWPNVSLAAGAALDLADRGGATQSSYQLDEE